MNYEKIIAVLKAQVKPALGCTEPVAVAIAVSKACKMIEGDVKGITVKISPNIFKNAMRVGIPGTKETGLPFAVALAAVCGNPDLGLEVFSSVNDHEVEEAKKLLNKNVIKVETEKNKAKFYIEAVVCTEDQNARCIIEDYHTNIVYVEKNGQVVFSKDADKEVACSYEIDKIGDYTLSELRETIETIPFKDIEFLLEGSKMNMAISKRGMEEKSGIGVGAGMNLLMQKGALQGDLASKVRMETAAATDARMSGMNLPVMSSAGSGNHGITAIVGPTVVCRELGLDDEKLARSLALSHLITIYIKEFTGKLSPVCGCSVAAGIGASAAIAWLFGCNDEQIAGTINNMTADIAGMLCDGAKGGCALKLSTASSEAVISAQLAKNNVIVKNLDGIVGMTGETTIRNLGKLCMEGMNDIDDKIIEIMLAQ